MSRPLQALNYAIRLCHFYTPKSSHVALRIQAKVATRRLFTTISLGDTIEEETLPGYIFQTYYPVQPGKLLHQRYETTVKLGFGSQSTVWLARDTNLAKAMSETQSATECPWVTLKIGTCGFASRETAQREWQINKHLNDSISFRPGRTVLHTMIDSFDITGPYGSHSRMNGGKLPLDLLRWYLNRLLHGLKYLHSERHVIHTDLKLDNLLMNFEDPWVLEEFAHARATKPMHQKIRDGRIIYQSHNDFGSLRSFSVIPYISDFGLAERADIPELKMHPIQPDSYRAPEVILGIGWSYSADIWNLGVMLWDMVEGKDLFSKNIYDGQGRYQAKNHLSEMIALLGPPPEELLNLERERRNWKWSNSYGSQRNVENSPCMRSCEYFGGPFFDNQGLFLYPDLIPTGMTLENSITSLKEEEKRLFLDFVVNNMLCWIPEERKTAEQLLSHPWLQAPLTEEAE